MIELLYSKFLYIVVLDVVAQFIGLDKSSNYILRYPTKEV